MKSAATLSLPEVGPPKFPPELEYPEVCTTLVLVSKSVYAWIDPILISTTKLGSFLAKLTSGKHPAEYYAQHVKSLAFFGGHYKDGEIDGTLAICTGVENLVVGATDKRFAFFNRMSAGTALRRLYIDLFSTIRGSATTLSFNHACFRSLTHLHLTDDDRIWTSYTGWEHLKCLTHLAFALCTPEILQTVMQALPAVRYVAHGHYQWHGGRYRRANAVVNNNPHIIERWGVYVVFLEKIPLCDWEQGARGEVDFWDVVEDEVEKRLQDNSD
ncbi:hypothetical protein HYPSUDRAFT_209531 [Hypholoma sublateritium FD-334 SS-4]|uniref:Uncharacterized protein n=1 Tax=Hypholoma sublateritium (strain FD-334 SS-4) TaxID=945553 RepID=A0A0D2NA14_HYPSF|nr:hypothetical protein HYPSUDRAFT_209531 [Hypholoma sublateritium FD-334 SS-4]